MFRGFLFLLSTLTLWSTVSAVPLQYMATRAAGGVGMGTVDGLPMVSKMSSPRAICLGRTDDELLIGTNTHFRTYSRKTQFLGTVFGKSTAGIQDGLMNAATLSGPRGCVSVTVGKSKVVYFVERNGRLRYFKNDMVYSVLLNDSAALSDITVYNDKLYVVANSERTLWICLLDADGKPTCSSNMSLDGCTYSQFSGVAVNSRGIFTTCTEYNLKGLCWFSLSGSLMASVSGNFNSILSMKTGEMYAAVGQELQHVRPEPGVSNTIKFETFTGNSSLPCPPIKEGYNPSICGINKLYVVSEYEMYVTASNLMIAVTLPSKLFKRYLGRPPLPLGYPDESNVMPGILQVMTKLLNNALSTTETVVQENSLAVDDKTWKTDFSVEVQQKNYDATTTPGQVDGVDFSEAEKLVRKYYNETDEVVYTDRNIMPFCNETKLRLIEHALVEKVRSVLMFPRIYCDPPEIREISGNPNITAIKLLMPSTFGGSVHVNDTTHPLLEDAKLSQAMFDIVRSQYEPNNQYDITFPGHKYDFSKLSAQSYQQLRWIILGIVKRRLQQCLNPSAEESGNDESHESGSQDPTKCDVMISNRTTSQMGPLLPRDHHYGVIIPDGLGYDNISVQECLNATDWTPVSNWISKETLIVVPDNTFKCNRACIIAIAVASALVLTAIIVLLVVITSKRKRLATVVAPMKPKFKSTLDDDEEMISSNPLE